MSPEAELYGPAGNFITSTTDQSSSTQLPDTGVYTIRVDDWPSPTDSGSYNLNLQFTTGRCGFGIANGQTATGSIGAAGHQTSFVVCGIQGSSLVMSIARTSGNITPEAELYGPTGAFITSTISQSASQTLGATGTYTILIKDWPTPIDTGSYNLNVTLIGQSCAPDERVVLGLTSIGDAGGWIAVRSGTAGSYSAKPWTRLPWAAYNNSGKGVHAAAGDVDGDGRDELVLGLETGANGWFAVVDDATTNYALMQWIQVPWASYNSASGEVWPAVGDIDGDGRAEIVAGLGEGASGWFASFEDAASSFALSAWRRVGWPSYNAANGRTYPAIGNVDGIGGSEIIVGLGPGGGGWIEVFSSAAGGYGYQSWIQLPWPAYNAANGETHVAAGDLDGDGRAEIVAGLGTGGYGWLLVFDDAAASYAPVAWRRTSWATYNADSTRGQTFPAVGDIDGDPRAEVVLGLGPYPGVGGWFEMLDDGLVSNASLGWRNVSWSAFTAAGGGLFPAVGRFR